jgi:hypothetical protein
MTLLFTSCSDDDAVAPEEYVTLIMDNQSIDMNNLGGSASADKIENIIQFFTLRHLEVDILLGNGYRLEVFIPGYDGPSTYLTATELNFTPIADFTSSFVLTRLDDQETWESSQEVLDIPSIVPGEFTVETEQNGYIQGVFSFEAYDGSEISKKVITDGRFKILLDSDEY